MDEVLANDPEGKFTKDSSAIEEAFYYFPALLDDVDQTQQIFIDESQRSKFTLCRSHIHIIRIVKPSDYFRK